MRKRERKVSRIIVVFARKDKCEKERRGNRRGSEKGEIIKLKKKKGIKRLEEDRDGDELERRGEEEEGKLQ